MANGGGFDVQLSYNYTAPVSNATFSVNVTDHASAASASTNTFTVVNPATTTSISAPGITYGSNGVVIVTVISSAGTPAGNVTLSVDSGSPITQTLSGGSSTFTLVGLDAISHSLSATYARQGIFLGSSATGILAVNKAFSTTTTVGSGPLTYTGSAQVGGSGTVTGAGTITGNATLSYSSNPDGTGIADEIDAGTYYVTAHYAGDANHLPSDGDPVAITINQAALTTTTLGDGPFTYNGATQTGGSGTVTGAGGLSVNATSLSYSGDQINAGTYYVTAHYAGDANHLPSDGSPVAITINQAASTTTTVGAGPFTYDGTSQTGGSGTVSGAGGLSVSATSLTYSGDQIDAGTYYVTAHYAGDANHTASDGSPVAITISQATSTTTTVGAGPFTYDGTSQTGGSGTVSGAGGAQRQRHLADLQWRPDRRRHLLRDGSLRRRRQPPAERRRSGRYHHRPGGIDDDHGRRWPVRL